MPQDKAPSGFTVGVPPYDGGSLVGISIPTGTTPPYATRKAEVQDLLSGSPIYSGYNGYGVYPASNTHGLAITANFSGIFPGFSTDEVTIWNTVEASDDTKGGIVLRQKTGAGSHVDLAYFYTDTATYTELDVIGPDGTILVSFGGIVGDHAYLGTDLSYFQIGGVKLQPETIYTSELVSTSQLDATSNTTLATVAGLSAPLIDGKTYYIEGWLSVTAGVKWRP